MAVSNRHVRWDWNTLVDHDEFRYVSTLCGKKSTRTLVGIPGISQQPRTVLLKDGSERLGWCVACMSILASYLPNDEQVKKMIPEVQAAHLKVRAEVYEFALTIDGLNQGKRIQRYVNEKRS